MGTAHTALVAARCSKRLGAWIEREGKEGSWTEREEQASLGTFNVKASYHRQRQLQTGVTVPSKRTLLVFLLAITQRILLLLFGQESQ